VIVFVLFAIFAGDSGMFSSQGVLNWSVVSAQFMIIAVGACLLMIAGEFDLSVGSMIGFAGMMIAIFSITLGWPVWQAIIDHLCAVHRHRRRSTASSWCAPGCRASS
jgi:simple sugar transport system permease protein